MEDKIDSMHGRLTVCVLNEHGKIVDEIELGKNSISYRAKAIMSRLLGGGGVTSGGFTWGTSADSLAVTGIALGNGGHLIYNADSSTDKLNVGANNLVLDSVTHDTTRVAMPWITAQQWGYDSTDGNAIPGDTYEQVGNGNVPWDGTATIKDNKFTSTTDSNIAVTEANTTLFSETIRIPLDSADGVTFPSDTEVQFKATLGPALLNITDIWGFAQTTANVISEAGLITGYVPGNPTSGQLYSSDGLPPSGTNFGSGGDTVGTGWDGVAQEARKDISDGSNGPTDFAWGTLPRDPASSTWPDTWASGDLNTWNIVARKTFAGVSKSSGFSLVFLWTVGY